MILLSSFFIFLSLFLFLRPLLQRYEADFRRMESEWLGMVQQGLSQEFYFVDPRSLKNKTRLIALGGLVVSLVMTSIFPFLLALLLGWGLPYLLIKMIQKRRQSLFSKQFASVLPQLSSILRAGHTFERAIESIARTQPPPLSQELGLVLKEIRLGTSMDRALENLLNRFPGRDQEIVVRAVGISRRVGSNLAEAFDRVADMVRSRAVLRNRLRALTAQGRMQAWIAIALPLFLTFALRYISPFYLDPLFHSRKGNLTLILTGLWMLIGAIWVQKISRVELLR